MKASQRDPRVYLEDIHAAGRKIGGYIIEGEHTFFTDEKTQDAVIRQISIIGEAASKLPSALKKKYPDIPWQKIVGMRNILVHEYSDVNLKRVWEVVDRDLPVLRDAVEIMLEGLSS